jgi:hypothetical protein
MINKKILLVNSFVYFTISSNCSLHFQFLNNNIELIYSTMTSNDSTTPTKIIIPLKNSPRQVNRHMLIDIEKSIKKSLLLPHDSIQFQFCGESDSIMNQIIIGDQTLYDQQAFYSATQWLLNTQDLKTGCWFIHVKRNYDNNHHYHLRMPWCSAMAQGKFLSKMIQI